MAKKNIAVCMGGYSTEVDISIKSGMVVCGALDTEKYNIYPVHILQEGWFYLSPSEEKHPIDKSNFSFYDGTKTIIPDAVFNTIHGTPGENGLLAAYLELLNIRQTSAPSYQAALTFNKRDCLSVLKGFGIHCATSYYVNKGDELNVSEIIKKVGLPCFVKPNRAGSSFGISRVTSEEGFMPALDVAFKEDAEVIIEKALVGTEISIGIYSSNGEIKAFSPTEIVSENAFFDYDAKYLGQSQEITPARISEELIKAVQTEAIRIYKILNMKGVSRSEFIIQQGIPHLIEVNTTPGLSKESIIPKQIREAGMTLTSFFGDLIEEALR